MEFKTRGKAIFTLFEALFHHLEGLIARKAASPPKLYPLRSFFLCLFFPFILHPGTFFIRIFFLPYFHSFHFSFDILLIVSLLLSFFSLFCSFFKVSFIFFYDNNVRHRFILSHSCYCLVTLCIVYIIYILILILYRVIYKYPSNIYTSLRYVIYYIVYSYKHYSVKSSILLAFTVNKPLIRSFVVNRRYISVFFCVVIWLFRI